VFGRRARESSQANSNSASGGEDVLPISGVHALCLYVSIGPALFLAGGG
jgi:hypothetical protein